MGVWLSGGFNGTMMRVSLVVNPPKYELASVPSFIVYPQNPNLKPRP
jgi:hypothetical protein